MLVSRIFHQFQKRGLGFVGSRNFQSLTNCGRTRVFANSIGGGFQLFKNYSVTSSATLTTLGLKMEGEKHSKSKSLLNATWKIVVMPATQDNYMYLIVDRGTMKAFVVDPVEPESVMKEVKDQKVELVGILTTHHHWDHAGGNKKLVELVSGEGGKLAVYGGDDRIEGLTNKIGQDDKINLGSLEIDCLFTPCHTSGHICYYIKSENSETQKPAVFTGDTLFVAGCGRFFEGTPEQMHEALIGKLGNLPNDTFVFCGHEYTVNNLKFALSVEPNNEHAQDKISWARDQRSEMTPTVPSTIGEEKKINPFMRCVVPELQKKFDIPDAVKLMGHIRELKDNYKA